MNVGEKYQRLVTALLAKTEAGELHWQQMPREDVYMAALKGSAVTIGQVLNEEDLEDPHYEISLLNANGNVVDSFFDAALYTTPDGKWHEQMRDLFKHARRQALGSDKVLNEILEELTAA